MCALCVMWWKPSMCDRSSQGYQAVSWMYTPAHVLQCSHVWANTHTLSWHVCSYWGYTHWVYMKLQKNKQANKKLSQWVTWSEETFIYHQSCLFTGFKNHPLTTSAFQVSASVNLNTHSPPTRTRMHECRHRDTHGSTNTLILQRGKIVSEHEWAASWVSSGDPTYAACPPQL